MSTSTDFSTTSALKGSWLATRKSRNNATPNTVQIAPTRRLCPKFSRKRVMNVRVRLPSYLRTQSRTTPNMAAVEGKIVTTGRQATNHIRFSRKKSVAVSSHL